TKSRTGQDRSNTPLMTENAAETPTNLLEGKLKPVKVRTDLVGTTELLMHNVRLANPDDPFAKAISRISSKRKKTEEDRREMAHLEWMGSLYTSSRDDFSPEDIDDDENVRIVMPQTNIKRAFKEAAKATR